MNYQQEIQVKKVLSSGPCPSFDGFRVQSVDTNLRTANDRQVHPVCQFSPLGGVRGGTASPQNPIAYGKDLRKMKPLDPKKEKRTRSMRLAVQNRLARKHSVIPNLADPKKEKQKDVVISEYSDLAESWNRNTARLKKSEETGRKLTLIRQLTNREAIRKVVKNRFSQRHKRSAKVAECLLSASVFACSWVNYCVLCVTFAFGTSPKRESRIPFLHQSLPAARSSQLSALCSVPFSLCPVVTPALLKRSKMKNVITKQFKTT